MLEEAKPIWCCHDLIIDIGGVEAKLPVFVVEHCNGDIILGRPRERAVRAAYIRVDDGSYTVIIKSRDWRRVMQFCAMTADHEWDREFIRHADEGTVGSDFLKVWGSLLPKK